MTHRGMGRKRNLVTRLCLNFTSGTKALVGKKGADKHNHDGPAQLDDGSVAEADHGIGQLERYDDAGKPT